MSRSRVARVIIEVFVGFVIGGAGWWLSWTIGWPTTPVARIAFVVLVAGTAFFITSLMKESGLFDRKHRLLKRLARVRDFAGIVEVDLPPFEGKGPLYLVGDYLEVAKAGLLTGRYRTAVEHARAVGDFLRDDWESLRQLLLKADRFLAQGLTQLGVHEEVRDLLRPYFEEDHQSRRIMAQQAIEVGDDELAEEMLSVPGPAPIDEGGRLRVLGDLQVRRGRADAGIENLEQAKRIYEQGGWEVDAAYCDLHMIEAQLATGNHEFSPDFLDGFLERVGGVRHDNYAGLSQTASIVGRAYASIGAVEQAVEMSDRAMRWAVPTEAPALIALAHQAKADAAEASGETNEAIRHLEAAHELLFGVDALPEARKVDADLERLRR